MRSQNKYASLLLVILVLSLAALACGTGYRTTKKISGNSGSVRVQLNDASGENSTSVEINEDWPRTRVNASATISLESGSCRAALIGEDNTQIILDAAAGSPGQAAGTLITNGFGDITLETNCQGGQNLDLNISFNR